MVNGELALRQEILRSNHALRDWAAGLRARSENARAVARVRRAGALGLAAVEPVETITVAADPSLPVLPSLGHVRVADLFVILVDDHGFGVMEAVGALAAELMVAGYPTEYDQVSAPDAMDILQGALRRRG